jgi:exodeoxyribonuclease V alpha subunit
VTLWLAGLELGDALTEDVLEAWGADAREALLENPYVLMELRGVGFSRADDLARRKFDVSDHDPRRLAAAVLEQLAQAERQGHTWSTIADLCT